jgi:hypothetical protein
VGGNACVGTVKVDVEGAMLDAGLESGDALVCAVVVTRVVLVVGATCGNPS